MQQFEWTRCLAGICYRAGNCGKRLLKFSDGFRRKFYGLMSIAAVLGAFSALSQAVKASTFRSRMRCGAVLVLPPPWPLAGSCLAND
jgi:hypothetical protein